MCNAYICYVSCDTLFVSDRLGHFVKLDKCFCIFYLFHVHVGCLFSSAYLYNIDVKHFKLAALTTEMWIKWSCLRVGLHFINSHNNELHLHLCKSQRTTWHWYQNLSLNIPVHISIKNNYHYDSFDHCSIKKKHSLKFRVLKKVPTVVCFILYIL